MIVTNGQERIHIVFVVTARNYKSLVRFLKSRSACTGIARKHAALVSDRLFEEFNTVAAAACTGKHHIHREAQGYVLNQLVKEQ
jgi:hypothetical protein